MSNEVREDAWLRRNPPHPGPGILNGSLGVFSSTLFINNLEC